MSFWKRVFIRDSAGNDRGANVNVANELNVEASGVETNQTDGGQKTQIVDGSGNVIASLDNALNVHRADVHDTIINRYLVNFTGTTSNLGAAASAGDTALTVVSDAGFAVGDWLRVTEGVIEETNFLKVTAKPGANVLTLDRPIDNAYTTGTPAVVEIVEPNIATAVGSLNIPISFTLVPQADETFHILRLLLSAESSAESSVDEFLSLATLTNGVVVRVVNNGVTRILTNWKKDADLIEDMYDLEQIEKPPAGKFGQRGRWTFKKVSSFVSLIGTTGDYLEVLVQNDLTGSTLDDFQIKAQGHLEG